MKKQLIFLSALLSQFVFSMEREAKELIVDTMFGNLEKQMFEGCNTHYPIDIHRSIYERCNKAEEDVRSFRSRLYRFCSELDPRRDVIIVNNTRDTIVVMCDYPGDVEIEPNKEAYLWPVSSETISVRSKSDMDRLDVMVDHDKQVTFNTCPNVRCSTNVKKRKDGKCTKVVVRQWFGKWFMTKQIIKNKK